MNTQAEGKWFRVKGNKSLRRPNKLAAGMSTGKNKIKTRDARRLSVYGSNDRLARWRWDFIRVWVSHPVDPDYRKQVFILKKNFDPAKHSKR